MHLLSSRLKIWKIAELPVAVASGPHHFAKILDKGMNADRSLELLENALSSDSIFDEKIAELPGAATPSLC